MTDPQDDPPANQANPEQGLRNRTGQISAAQALAGQQQAQRPATPEEWLHNTVSELHARLAHLEIAFQASLSHQGASHPNVVSWLRRMRDRVSQVLGGAPKQPDSPQAPQED